ncbi:MAG: gamma-glutamylcyclotransferase family protein [Chloroflexota bacterium]
MFYFAYAGNLKKAGMQALCPGSKPLYTAVLPNYKLIFAGWSRQWHGALAGIRLLRGERVRGAVYEVSEQCLRQLDIHETGYSRLKVTVFGEDDEAIEAVTYIRSGQAEEGKPSPEYLAVIQQGYRDWRLF